VPVFQCSPNNFVSEFISPLLSSESDISTMIALRRIFYTFRTSQALTSRFLSDFHEKENLENIVFDMLVNEMFRLPVEKVAVIQISRILMSLTQVENGFDFGPILSKGICKVIT
jgi:hypothetical protein